VAAAEQALIRPVAAAVTGGVGLAVEPGRDYRGVGVVSAWRWLPQQQFGVVTQIDAAEGYRSLRMIRMLFLMLFLLLVLLANGLLLFSYLSSVWRRRMSEAELKARQLGQYQLEEKVGEGGMGVVYRAHHALLRRETALKLLLPDRADARAIRRFEQEVRLTSRLAHPNTIQIYDYGYTPDGVFYYAMEFLRGVNLDELVKRFGPQPEGRVAYLLAQVCDSLREAHALGLIHRDIKPANVFVANRGGVPDSVKVLDFGLARDLRDGDADRAPLTGVTGIVGTPLYMPPEAIRGTGPVDARSDIYSLGALGYFLLTGRHVFEGPSIMDICAKHLNEAPVPPGSRSPNPISAELEAVVLRCLAKEPDRRPQSVVDLHLLLTATPRFGDWNLEARTGWWAHHEAEVLRVVAGGPVTGRTPAEATLPIDLGLRETRKL
jgi:serine/threonine protein kinase